MDTNLTPEHLEQLRTQALRTGPFANPAHLRAVQEAHFYPEWATAVLGRPYPGVRHLHAREIALLALALNAEPDRPLPAAVAERRAATERERQAKARAAAEAAAAERADWDDLRARLPVPVFVAHNWTLIHTGSYHVGKDHIVVDADLRAGRLYRPRWSALCETAAPKKKRASYNGTNRDPLRGLDRHDDGEDRIPTCRACLKVAERIAAPAGP